MTRKVLAYFLKGASPSLKALSGRMSIWTQPVVAGFNLWDLNSAVNTLKSAQQYLEKGNQYCAEIIDTAKELQKANDPRHTVAGDLAVCCIHSMSSCPNRCSPPNRHGALVFAHSYLSIFPIPSTPGLMYLTRAGAQSEVRALAEQCAACVYEGGSAVQSATSRDGRVQSCGTWRR